MPTLYSRVLNQVVAALLPLAALTQSTADAGGMTLAEFRSAVAARLAAQPAPRSREKTPPSDPRAAAALQAADEAFLQLLTAQARLAAAQQSLDRLAGWSKAIQARLEAQNAPALDAETI